MSKKRRRFTAEFKKRVALEALGNATRCSRSRPGTKCIRTR